MSEHTFYCPGVGVWGTTNDVSRATLQEYPPGTREIDPSPGVGYTFDGLAWVVKVPTVNELRSAKIAAIIAKAETILSAGYPSNGLHVSLDDGSRADFTAMAATATAAAAAANAVPWPDSYARGWISKENVRIPLATPAEGLTLAASVGNHYASIVQHRRDLKDAANAAEDAEALAAIDTNSGWPE